MKKLLFSAVDMNVGGIETALLSLLNTLVEHNYSITLVLENKQGTFLKDLDSRIQIIEYKPCHLKIVPIRKIVNFIKRITFALQYKDKFDFSVSYATYSQMASYTARTASGNNVLWVHSDYMEIYHKDMQKVRNFFDNLNCEQFKHITFVSETSKNSFLRVYPDLENKVVLIGNLINASNIQVLSEEEIELDKEDCYTFLIVGRHDELEKRLSRAILASEKLKKDSLLFKVWLIGSGKDTKVYEELIKQKGLEEQVQLLGTKRNPYPYFKKADCLLLTSDYEGYPVVFQEAFVLNKPIITTDVSDARLDIENKFGKVVKKEIDEIYKAMKEFIEHGYQITTTFEAHQYNQQVLEKIERIRRKVCKN